MTHTRFLIFSKASSCECIWIQFPYTINCTNASRYTWNLQSGRMYDHFTCFVPWIERDWFHFKSPSDPSVSEQQSAHHDNHWWSNCWLYPHHGGYLQTMISRFDRLMFLFRDTQGNIMRLNGEFELQLTIEDVYDQVPSSIPRWTRSVWSKRSETLRRRMWSWTILSHSISATSRLCHSIPFSCCTMCQPIKW